MKILNEYVKNSYRREASIVQRYIVKEAIEFCTTYMSEADSVDIPRYRYEGWHEGKGTRGVRVVRKDHWVHQAHLYILNNTDSSLLICTQNVILMKSINPHAKEKWLLTEHNKTFLKWYKEKIGQEDCEVDEWKWLA